MHSVRLEDDEYFVLGDNRTGSQDSRHWGTLAANHIIGKVWAVLLAPIGLGVSGLVRVGAVFTLTPTLSHHDPLESRERGLEGAIRVQLPGRRERRLRQRGWRICAALRWPAA